MHSYTHTHMLFRKTGIGITSADRSYADRSYRTTICCSSTAIWCSNSAMSCSSSSSLFHSGCRSSCS